jgi:hypothetical protein
MASRGFGGRDERLFDYAVKNTITHHPIGALDFFRVGVCHGDAFAMMVVDHGTVAASLYGFLATGHWFGFRHRFLLKELGKATRSLLYGQLYFFY